MHIKRNLVISCLVVLFIIILPITIYAYDYRISSSDNVFELPKKIVYDGSFVNSFGYGDIILENISFPISKVTSSKKSVIDSCEIYNNENTSIISLSKKGVGTTTITVKDEAGHSKKCTVVIKDDYFYYNYMPYSNWNYGEREIEVTSMPKSKITITINGDKYTATANANGKAKVKVKKDYKYKSVYKLTSRFAGKRKTSYRSIVTNAFARINGTFWNCKNYIPFRLVGVHKGDVVVVKTNTQSKVYTVTSDYPHGVDLNIYMNSNIGRTPYISYKIKNKYGQKLYESKNTITW